MLEITVDGQTYQLDMDKLMSSEAKVIQRATGMLIPEWRSNAAKGDAFAMDGLIWLVRSRNGEDCTIEDVEYDMGSLQIRDLDADEDAETDPTQTASDEPSPDNDSLPIHAVS